MNGLRLFRYSPVYSIVAMATLAIAIAAGTATFAVVHAVLWKPLPYRDAARIVVLGTRDGQFPRVRDSARSFDSIAAIKTSVTDQEFNATAGSAAEHVTSLAATSSLFPLLGIAPYAGRTFLPRDEHPSAAPVAMLSYGLWQRMFAADPNAVGRTLQLDGHAHTVVGILPRSFGYSPNDEPPDVWLPLRDPASRSLQVIAKLRPGITPAPAAAEIQANIIPLREHLARNTRQPLLTLLGAVSFVLLIAGANLTILALARAQDRRRERDLRLALGATPWRLLGDALSESVALGGCAGLIGITLSLALVRGTVPLLPPEVPHIAESPLDTTVLVIAFSAALATSVLAGIGPTLLASARLTIFRNALIVVEVALAVILLTGAGLMVRTLTSMQRVDLGYNVRNLNTLEIRRNERDPLRWRTFYRAALDRIAAVPGVESAALVAPLPLSRNGFVSTLKLEDRATPDRVSMRVVSDDYFRLMGIALRRGRGFTGRDDDTTAVITETMARRYWPNADPIGKRILLPNFDAARWLTVAGVVADIRDGWLLRDSLPQVYVPFATPPIPWVSFLVRTTTAATVVPLIREQVMAIDPGQPIYHVRDMEQVVAAWFAPQRFSLSLLAAFAATALLLTAAGLYAVIAYLVSSRTREIGIRIAVGARPSAVVRLVLGNALSLALAGIATGIAASLYLTRFLATQLYGVSAIDPATLATVAAVLTVVSVAAAYSPARRAAAVDPVVALRAD